jgi:hypothetical protein
MAETNNVGKVGKKINQKRKNMQIFIQIPAKVGNNRAKQEVYCLLSQ